MAGVSPPLLPCIPLRNGNATRQGWVFEGSGDLLRCSRRWWLGSHRAREPASSDRLPVHRSESPTGYSSPGCSPAEPASALPVTDRVAAPDPAMQSNALLNRPLPVSHCKDTVQASATPLAEASRGKFCLDERPSLSHLAPATRLNRRSPLRPLPAFGCDAASRWACGRQPEGCHLYFARRVTFLSCADI
jgi:hypothetical protein